MKRKQILAGILSAAMILASVPTAGFTSQASEDILEVVDDSAAGDNGGTANAASGTDLQTAADDEASAPMDGIMELSGDGSERANEQTVELLSYNNETSKSFEYPKSQGNGTGMTVAPDSAVATAEYRIENRPVICSHKENTRVNNDLSSFENEADTSLSLETAEFTLTAQGGDNKYYIYNDTAEKYLANPNGNQYFNTTPCSMTVLPKGNGKFRIYHEAHGNHSNRCVQFLLSYMAYASSGNLGGDGEGFQLTLFEKQDCVSEDDNIPGYKKVNEITSGKKYLISYVWKESQADEKIILLYPEEEPSNLDKSCYKRSKLIQTLKNENCSLTFTGVGKGTTDAVVDGTTYHISSNQISLSLGESRFIEGVSSIDSQEPEKVSGEAGIEARDALYDYKEQTNNLNAFWDVPNKDIDIADAEFIVDAKNTGYTIRSKKNEKIYLVNTGADSYFSNIDAISDSDVDARTVFSLTPMQSGAEISFEIARYISENQYRYVYFYYSKMVFDGLQGNNLSTNKNWTEQGDFGFELLEKQDHVSNLDAIPGYRRASEIKPGHTYLLTEYYHDGEKGDAIIVLYPINQKELQTKLYRKWNVSGVYVNGVADTNGQPVTVTIDGADYDVTVVNDCTHDVGTYVTGEVAATCDTEGSTGDTYCSKCNQIIKGKETLPALGHDFRDDWQVEREASLTEAGLEDGLRVRHCHRDTNHTEEEAISAYVFGKTTLTELLAEYAQGLNPAEDYYTSESKAAYDAAVGVANEILTVEEDTPENRAQLLSAITGLQAAYEGLEVAVGQVSIESDETHPITDGTITLEIDESATLTASVEPEEATDKTVVWSIGDEEAGIASLTENEDGSVTVTARSEGTVTVTAAAGDKSASCTVYVPAPEAVTVSDNGKEIQNGETFEITRQLLVELDNGDRTLDLSFNSKGDTHILEVSVTDENGNAFAEGEEILTCDITGQSAEDLDEGDDLDTANDLEFSETETENGEEAAGLKLNLHPVKSGTAKVTVYCKENADTVKTEFTVEILTDGTIQFVDENGTPSGTMPFFVDASGEATCSDHYQGAKVRTGYEAVYPDNMGQTLERIAAGEVLIEVAIAYKHRITVKAPGYIENEEDPENQDVKSKLASHMDLVTIHTDDTNELGQKFVGWHDGKGYVSYSSSYTLYARKNITLEPRYENIAEDEIPPVISNISGSYKTMTADGKQYVYTLTASRVVPAAATKTGKIDEQGFLISTKTISEDDLKLEVQTTTENGQEKETVVKPSGVIKKNGQSTGLIGSYILDVRTVKPIIYVKSYVIYTDRDGHKKVVCSKMQTVGFGETDIEQ